MPDLFVAEKPQGTPSALEKNIVAALDNASALPTISAGSPHEQKGKIGPFTSFCLFPSSLEFENQETHERIYLFLRAHMFTNISWMTTSLILLIIPLLLPFVLPFSGIPSDLLTPNYALVLLLFYYLLIFGYAFINFIRWFYHVGIITQIRVIDIDIINIMNKNVASTGIDDIVDVEYTQSGFLSSILDFGNVHMQTEGLKANFEFHSVPRPAKVSDVINDLMTSKKNE